MDLRIAVTGFVVGILVGLTGMGGGSLMTPILVLVNGISPTVAIGSDLAHAAITKWIGGWRHSRAGAVRSDIVWRLAAGSVPGSVAGVWTIRCVERDFGAEVQHVLLRVMGVMLVAVALSLLWQLRTGADRHRLQNPKPAPSAGRAAAIGLVVGYCVGLTSIGSGSIFGVALLTLFGLRAREMVGTDVYHAAILSTAAGLAHWSAGHVDLGLVASLLLGSVPGVVIGSHVAAKAPERVLQVCLVVVLFIVGMRLV